MAIILVGLDHRTAPVALREQLTLSGCALDMALNDLNALRAVTLLPDDVGSLGGIHESVIVSTCNRLEIYAATDDPEDGFAAIERFLCGLQGLVLSEVEGLSSTDLHPYLYLLQDQAAVEHLLRVASGLDSMILGEPQILGQVAQAQARAQGAGTAGLMLSQLFARAVHTGKRARSETAISRHTTSVSHAAARLARDTFGDLSQARVLIVGAGEMAELAATALVDEGARRITCINRTYARAERLACRFEGRALYWGYLADALAEADVIVSATGAPHTVIYRDDVLQVVPDGIGCRWSSWTSPCPAMWSPRSASCRASSSMISTICKMWWMPAAPSGKPLCHWWKPLCRRKQRPSSAGCAAARWCRCWSSCARRR